MSDIETRIRDFMHARGVEVVGIAGPERLDGPPSLDPTYTMPGARSIVSFALPMDVGAIYDWFSKKSQAPHELDQLRMNQRTFRVSRDLADWLVSQGYRAKEVPANSSYRRHPDVVSTLPSFSHRFGAMAAGIAGQGWSGNVMTKEHGAAVYLGTVVTDAELASDPALPPRHFVDEYCAKCKLCARTCVAGMFEEEGEEQVLLNGELHPRGKRRNIDFCNTSCFGLHALSPDLKWSTWGRGWINGWIMNPPDPKQRRRIRAILVLKSITAGDSAPRYDLIRKITIKLYPEEMLEYVAPEKLPESESELSRYLLEHAERIVGVIPGLKDPYALTCGNCALVCGPDIKETAERYRALVESGIVVPGPDGLMTRVDSFEEALEMRRKYMPKPSLFEMARDALAMGAIWYGHYFGFEPRSFLAGLAYKAKLKKAVRDAAAV
ncbi:MAG: epoxyqueuosine reductase [Actinobacteria bacterium]|jgi:epoxyqueuosine reductase QueG|nr:MAG: epoxyqueuosine reductase [Actinomycetota bacterium]